MNLADILKLAQTGENILGVAMRVYADYKASRAVADAAEDAAIAAELDRISADYDVRIARAKERAGAIPVTE